ncbi:hypothetical protein Pmani_020412 [Petrolisthes manimaculis]|uniref:Uncharacterized protein n=1 Tax=Petrolisthes manimaculis TaxID=1843537 RepID=A0AAE1PHR8_9EUCA|nr:hypothetical protein Pmani_020412 [Petrolisthes manimaculis]
MGILSNPHPLPSTHLLPASTPYLTPSFTIHPLHACPHPVPYPTHLSPPLPVCPHPITFPTHSLPLCTHHPVPSTPIFSPSTHCLSAPTTQSLPTKPWPDLP